ncbi:MAG TPA: protein kinase [Gemmatimonadaceae bacterium]|nr:protein kinase [Gemmatimonadaceae bacterium]
MANDKVCPQCGTRYEADHMFCFLDGAALIQAQNSTDLVGSIIADRYRVVSKIGDGGMGQVYLAEHVRMKRRCAVKIMRPQLMSDPVAVVRFNREAENASQISHPNVCAVYDFGETPAGLIYLAMEYIDGEPLSTILEREEALIPVRAADVISQTADALSAAHGLGILHRDLKPDNIMIAKSRAGTDHVKIVDFGIARVMSKESQQLTSTGIAVGTPEYMSPEQFAGDTLDARTDIYSLALVAYHVVTGTHAFGSGTTTDHLLARLTQPPRRLSAVKADVDWPESMQRVFDKALSADPSQRYSDVLDFARDFTDSVAELPVTTTEEHYLSAIATRRLTPPRTFTPARGVPTMEVSTSGTGSAADASETATAGAWEDSSPAVAVTTPSGERPTQEITPLAREGVGAETTRDRDTPPPHPPATAGDVAGADGEEPTVTIPAMESERPAPKRRTGVLVGAGLLVATAAVAAAVALRPGPTTTAQVAPEPALPNADSLAAAAPPAESLATVAPPAAPALALDSAVMRMRDGVVGVISAEGRGTGFLADTTRGTALVVTSASFVPRDSIVDVQVDGSTRLRGRVAAADRSAGIAVVAVALRPWSGYRVLPIGADTSLKGGDSLAALGSAFVGPSVKRGVARESEQGRARPSVSVVRADAGRPVVSATSAVVAVATVRGNQSTYALASAVDATLRAARGRVGRDDFPAPNATVLPAWPMPAYPAARVREASRRDSIDTAPYRAAANGFRVFAMTPPVLAWRDSAIARTRAYWDSPFQLNKYPYERIDPIQAWSGFRATVAERRPVIVLSVVPDGVPELQYRRFPDVSDQRSDRVDVRSARLIRNGETILPLDSTRFPAVVNPKDYRDRGRPVRDERLFVFRLDALAQTGAYSVEIVPSSGRAVNLVLPQALLDAVRQDAGQWRPAR